MEAIQQVDERRLPWVSHVDSRIALIASALSGGHDGGYRLSKSLLKRFKDRVVSKVGGKAPMSTALLLDALRSAFSGVSGVEGLHVGIAVVNRTCWRVWTAGLVYSVRWSPGQWTTTTEPQSAARQLREQGVHDIPDLADNVAVKVARPSTTPDEVEYAEVTREPGTGVFLLASEEAGRRLGSAAGDPSWLPTSATEVLNVTTPLTPGSPVATFVALVEG